MKVDVATTRDDATLELGMFLGTPYAWELLDRSGYDSSTRIVPVSEDEPFDRVVSEHMRQGGRTLVAVFFPGREGTDRFEFLQWASETLLWGWGRWWVAPRPRTTHGSGTEVTLSSIECRRVLARR